LRTPLNSACIGLDILSETCKDKSKFQSNKDKQFITDIRKSLQEAIQILNELLMYDKIESGVLELEITSFAVTELFQSITIYEIQVSYLIVNYSIFSIIIN
jgi:signal transduction histidine kinase